MSENKAEGKTDLDLIIENDPRLSFFKRGIIDDSGQINNVTLKKIILCFAEHYFIEHFGEVSRNIVWKKIVETETIENVNLIKIKSANDNQLAGLVKAARATVENPEFKFKTEFLLDTDYRSRMIQKFLKKVNSGLLPLKLEEQIKNKLPKILVVKAEENVTPHTLKKMLAEKSIIALEKYLENLDRRKVNVHLALTGGSTIRRFVTKFLSELDANPEFKNNLEKLSPIKIVEIADTTELSNLGLLENTRSLHLALCDMKLSSADFYLEYGKFMESRKNKKKENIKFQAIYTGLGKASGKNYPANNTPLLEKIQKKSSDISKKDKAHRDPEKFLFEVNAIPYYRDDAYTQSVRNELNNKITPIEDIESEYKIVLCSGIDKARAVYNLLLFSLLNPDKKIVTHLVLDNMTYNKVLQLIGLETEYSFEED